MYVCIYINIYIIPQLAKYLLIVFFSHTNYKCGDEILNTLTHIHINDTITRRYTQLEK